VADIATQRMTAGRLVRTRGVSTEDVVAKVWRSDPGWFLYQCPGGILFPLSTPQTEEEMTGLLILNAILSVGIVLVVVGMLVWAIEADRRALVGSKSRAAATPRVTAPAASLSAAAQ